MADRPIIFSAPMIRALLDGRKTMTRRVLAIRGHKTFSEFGPSDTPGYDWHFRDREMRWHDLRHGELLDLLNYMVGDRLWVREAWDCPTPQIKSLGDVFYKADGIFGGKYRPSIHMPRWASRLTLIVTGVKVERLRDISDADAQKEGIYERHAIGDDPTHDTWQWPGAPWRYSTAHEAFAALWTEIHGPGAWDANPWVAAISFRVVKANIDSQDAR